MICLSQQLNASIALTCRTLGVPRSWFYYRRQPHQPRPLRRPQLTPAIQQVLALCPPSYGYRRIHALLARQGIHAIARRFATSLGHLDNAQHERTAGRPSRRLNWTRDVHDAAHAGLSLGHVRQWEPAFQS